MSQTSMSGAFTDSQGFRRLPCVFGFNCYVDSFDAERAARRTLRSGSPFYVWELNGGGFIWTAIPNPTGRGYDNAVLVFGHDGNPRVSKP